MGNRSIDLTEHQPDPKKYNTIDDAVWMLVVQDLAKRATQGKTEYGSYLYPFNGRRALVDAYQEQLDGAQYLRQAIYEMERVRDAASQVVQLLSSGDIRVKASSLEAANDFDRALNVLEMFAMKEDV